jgi:hypothetical protein
LGYLGTFSFPIYLMNTIVIGTMKGVTFKLWNHHQFDIMVPFLVVGGLLVPILIAKYLSTRAPSLNKIIY